MIRLCAAIALLICCLWAVSSTQSLALDPPRGVGHLKLTEWGADQGAPPDIFKISQAPDGFLWLATSSGLYRFDGLTFEKIPPIPGDQTKSQEVVSVLAARDGSVWAGHRWGGLSVYRRGRLLDANHGPPTGMVCEIVEAPDGAVWVVTIGIKGVQISRYMAGRWADVGVSLGLHGFIFADMVILPDGTVKVQIDRSIATLAPGASKYAFTPTGSIGSALLKDRSGRVWSIDDKTVRLLPIGSSTPFPLHYDVSNDGVGGPCSLVDQTGMMFICRPDHAVDVMRIEDGLKRDQPAHITGLIQTLSFRENQPLTMYEDREGNDWIGTSQGLDQLRETNIVSRTFRTTPVHEGPWITTVSNGDLYLEDGDLLEKIGANGRSVFIKEINAPRIQAICADRTNGLWAASEKPMHWTSGKTIRIDPDPAWKGDAIHLCAVDGAGDLWVAVSHRGLFRRHGNAWTQIILDAARPNLWASYMTTDRQGRILAYAGLGKLYRISGECVESLGSTTELGIGFIRTIYPRASDILIGGSGGLSRYAGHRSQIISVDQHPWLASLAGIVQTAAGDTWLNGAEGIVRVRTSVLERAFANPGSPIAHEIFDTNDGLQGSVVRLANYEGGLSPDGRIWFQSASGLMSIDPAHLHRNATAPPVVIKSITANQRTYPAANGLVLPSGVTSLQIDYTALSLTAPVRNRFRYRLRGVDKDWVDPGARRQAFYTNLNPGRYRFEVIAANNDGVWNRTSAALDFRIHPAFWQTPVFLIIIIFALSALLWVLYSLRLQEMGKRIRLRLEDRVAERERIARELHDTLLQGFQGLTMRLQSVAEQIPPTEPTRQLLDQALDRADEVLVEGRERVKNLRAGEGNGELAFLIEAAAYRLRVDPDVIISMVVKGDCVSLHPVVCDELLAIANEALFNAFKHAGATQIDISLVCERRQTLLRIADNGVGFDSAVLAAISRPGRYGLVGMRERARKLKARLHIGNTADGAEIVATVPRRVAYASLKRPWSLFPRLAGLES